MSATKRNFEKINGYYELAKRILIEIGEIEICDAHDDYFYRTYKYDSDAIYGIATNKAKLNSNKSIDYTLFHQQIKRVLDDASSLSKCPFCEKQ